MSATNKPRIVTWDKELLEQTGPVEIEEPYNIMWNANDWPIYIRCPFSSDNNNLALIIQEGWMLTRPQIVISIISQFNTLEWDNEILISRFKQGLIKAASAARMWIITNGIDVGASKLISEAIENEKKWTKATHQTSPLLEAKCIGVVREDRITSDPLMQRNLKDIEKLNETNPLHQGRDRYKEGKFYIDSHHSHFIFVVKEEDSDLEQLLALDLFYELSQKVAWVTDVNLKKIRNEPPELSQTPLIAIIIQGDMDSATVVLQYLQKQLPVVVLRGTGGFADLLSIAYSEITDRKKQEGSWDSDFVEDILNPILSRKIVQMYPQYRDKLFQVRTYRDKVVECVRQALQEGVEYLTILNMFSSRIDLQKLDQYLLESYFKSRQIGENTQLKPQELLTADLHLTLAWNNSLIANNLLFKRMGVERVSVTKELFLRALIEPKREEFVDIFLRAGFHVRQLYNFSTLKWLIVEASKVEFFQDICCEGLLGISITTGFPLDDFLHITNKLICLCCDFDDFLRRDDLTNRYRTKPNCIEQKALAFITMWAVFVNNIEIVNKLWPYHNQPINLCLMVSTMLRKMSEFVSDINLQVKMLATAREYSEIATKLLEECYQASPWRATEMITLQSPHWSYHAASDVAVATEMHNFIAHPSCQKWLTNRFLNEMHIKQSTYGEFGLPIAVKIILCALLVFPINFWFDFPQHVAVAKKQKKQRYKHNLVEFQKVITGDRYPFMHDHNKPKSILNPEKQVEPTNVLPFKKTTETEKRQTDLRKLKAYRVSDIPFTQKWFIFFEAPITKYWLHHFSFVLFLILFTYTVTIPFCGDTRLDMLVITWISLMLMEDIRRTYMLLRRYVSVKATFKYIEIPGMVIFLSIYYLGRVMDYPTLGNHPYLVRMLMCCALFHYYVRYLAVFIPISSTFGPLFYRLKLMALNDFLQYLMMVTPIMIGSAIVMNVSLFPDDVIVSQERFHTMFHEAFYTFFKMFDSSLIEDKSCAPYKVNDSAFRSGYCKPTGLYTKVSCPSYGFWPYVFSISFLVQMKLVLGNLMYALFNNSLITLDALTIWRFQRFHTITEFSNCMPLPPPLSVLCYIYYTLKYLLGMCCKGKQTVAKKDEDLFECHGCADSTSAYFSRVICKRVVSKRAEVDEEKLALVNLQNESIITTGHLEYTKIQITKLRRTVINLQRLVFLLQTNVELMKRKKERKMEVTQILSRMSPYPNTQLERSPVSDRNILWEISWPEYEPPVYTQPKNTFPAEINPDDDTIVEIIDKSLELKIKPQFKFNAVSTPLTNQVYDRRSWIKDSRNKPRQYKCDGMIPLNPYGRTGLAGRGNLPRWGPNHFISILVTKYSVTVKGYFDVIMRSKSSLDTSECNLVGGFVSNDDTYDTVRRQVEKDKSKNPWKTSEEMIKFFEEQIDITTIGNERTIEEKVNVLNAPNYSSINPITTKKGIQYHKAFVGYLDSPLNTDNAWKEVEFWHFHYTSEECFKPTVTELSWITLKEDIGEKLSVGEFTLIANCVPYLIKT